ncbi:cobalt-precorrin-5B (C(1))-methyltransferase CbiD [Vibrio mangrovi]|uniref:Cobalt-precorrin-5B C(1)-methyltransferase n=1 Tax=Vibrio mangrovi TaxID=474394 RepID=A0A1Y6J015_9VIBR|nr:cobalt-precorrin-5B (C(1))-methyltransferase CbiD [Vibrio mangrovi]MDW6005190.1 cobalt-precorrin-5B (C(1))-methyltransferase CbiD [Vibrio mangrovi]SMS02601.1 cobalt-precorrin-6A synthase [Vibrio mangrovi]
MTESVLQEVVWHRGKAYRKGYTTGSCATAAAKVAALMVMRQQLIHQVSIVTPSGVPLHLSVEDASVLASQAVAAIRKDGGDDVDATHGMLIYARVTLGTGTSIDIVGGEGVGTVTRKGIGLPVGAAAINKTPRHTIEQEVREVIGPNQGAIVEIFAPEGIERAKKTYNARLGIENGISIIGTSGIVTPMSEESWKRSLAIELEQKKAQGHDSIILVPGNHGERFVRQQLNIEHDIVVTMSNFVGYMLQEANRLEFQHVLLVGHIGKLIKIAAGVFHTHSHIADARLETLVTHLALLGAPNTLLQQVYACLTTEEALELIEQQGYQAVYTALAHRICTRIHDMLKYASHQFRCDVVLFSYDNDVLGSNRPVEEIVRDYQ